MERCRVKTFVASTGEEMNVLLYSNGSPAYWPNLYSTEKLRNAGLSPKTILSILRSIGMAMDWMAPSGADFSERMVHGDPLLFDEANNLADFLALSVGSQNDWLKVERASAGTGSSPRAAVIRLEKVRPSHKAMAKDPREHLNAATAATNMRSVAGYLEWIYALRKHPNRIADFDPDRQIFAKEGLDQFRKQIPRVKGTSDDDETLWAWSCITARSLNQSFCLAASRIHVKTLSPETAIT